MSVFRIPELATLVCQYSDFESCVRILYLCRTSFLAALPFVWHTVDGADKLLTLIPDTVCKQKRDALFFIDLPASPKFDRYQLYAPHVKCLDVYGKKQKYFELHGWLNLITEFSASFRLPKLKALKIRTLDNAGVKDHLYWISAFVNGSTNEIAILPGRPLSGKFPWVSTQTASVILHSILDRAPAIRKLSFYPCNTSRNDRPPEKESCLLHFLHKYPFTELLGCFQYLGRLSTTSAVINRPGLQKLGRLPYLQVLSVSNSNDTLLDFDHELDDTYFPALSSLTLRFVDPKEAEVVLKITPLIRNLQTLIIRFCSDEIVLDTDDEDEDEGTWTAIHLLSHLEHASRLADLTIDFDMPKRREEILEIWDFSQIANRLVMLPIRKLTLQSVEFAIDNFTEEGFDGAMWPSLRQLYIPDQDASAEVLRALSGLPRLLILGVKLHLTGINAQAVVGGFVATSLFTIEATRGSTIDADSDNLEHHVGFLLTLWPNLMRVTWPEGCTAIEKMYIGCLNKHLRLTRRVKRKGEEDVSLVE